MHTVQLYSCGYSILAYTQEEPGYEVVFVPRLFFCTWKENSLHEDETMHVCLSSESSFVSSEECSVDSNSLFSM